MFVAKDYHESFIIDCKKKPKNHTTTKNVEQISAVHNYCEYLWIGRKHSDQRLRLLLQFYTFQIFSIKPDQTLSIQRDSKTIKTEYVFLAKQILIIQKKYQWTYLLLSSNV